MRPFDYREPATIEEAVALLAQGTDRTRVLAGGTDLLVRLKRRQCDADRIISIRRIASLRAISEGAEGLSIGSLVTLDELARSDIVAREHPILRSAALSMASAQVRFLATVGGNLCNASPAADLAPPFLCLDAVMCATGPNGARRIPIGEFFTAPGRTSLRTDEILTAVRIPPGRTRGTYLKFSPRRAMDLAVVSIACAAVDGQRRVALGAVAPTPIRVPPSPEEAAARCSPIDDLRASAEYRRAMVRVLTRRALESVP